MDNRFVHDRPVRIATPADVRPLARSFARAYGDDPLMSWFLPDESHRVDRLQRFFAAALGRMIRLRLRDVYTTDDAVAAAAWARPGTCKLPFTKMLPAAPSILRAMGVQGMRRSARAYGFLQKHHPAEPHWFLETIATDPDAQGQGFATSLMRPILDIGDREGLVAYLETQNPANVSFYEGRGFAVSGEVQIPDGGPSMWLMNRKPSV